MRVAETATRFDDGGKAPGGFGGSRRAGRGRGRPEGDDRIAALHAHLQRRSVGCYPASARRRGIEGEVVVAFRIDPRGLPVELEVVRGSGSPVLDEAAVRCVIEGAAPLPGPRRRLQIRIPFVLR